ncbi:protein PELOTA 1-like [Nicotiana sylvestris]|uniref:Protein PELOTA 1-like n=1 Tax=Nicotiana sylvestris TaxID=4096 RepID=A0A1U7VBB5_NICSY|nr:PREDICTED: protein PELOTA 1-like [Nicotiana sylvestris]
MKEGLAQVFLVGQSATIQGDKITKSNSGSKRFFENIFVSFRKHIDMDIIPYVVIASCESIKNEFRVYLLLEAQRSKIKSIENNKSRILLVNKNNVKEILHDKIVMSMMKDTKSAMDTKVLDEFMNLVSTNSKRACYGTKDVEYAHELMAVETLLITKEILKNEDNKVTQKYLVMEKSIKKAGGTVVQFNQDVGQRLAELTGIAAILRFPLPDVDELIL